MTAILNMDTGSLFKVDGMVAAITGGGTGIGLMMAKALANAGAKKVYILGRRKDKLDAAASETPALIPLECDVTSKESLQSVVDFITIDTGYINLLLANSGVVGPTKRYDPNLSISELRKSIFEDVSMDEFTQTFHVNVTGAFFTMMAFIELLDAGNKNALKGGFGAPLKAGGPVPSIQSQIITTASIAAYSRATFSTPAYSGSKAAIAHLTKHASSNLVKYGIRVNAIAPGLFPSDMSQHLMASRDPATESIDDPRFIPAGRFGGDEEMGGTILYLAGRAGAFNNGMILVMDGGRLSVMPSAY
ncbi:short chain dehydrogenase [Pseudomassariella vexata]|uniref:Short chain dehydrogenase n=1 Tax=Pseudomassariella vexata TaxID=1141098 RepID=A0A1Y2D7J4_9PEZI|nr:short chain dehydrogenase [Pseudomassariella vexata]ORY55248.1 short chain dehydrogenase [Pseudomassariella vexata]